MPRWDGFWDLYRLLNQSDPLIHIVNHFRRANQEGLLDIDDLPEHFDLEKEGALAWECLAQGWVSECVKTKMNGGDLVQPPFPTTFLTPYVHIFAFHVGEILQHIRSLADFSCQSLELCNNLQGASWYRQNSKRADEEAEQILRPSATCSTSRPALRP